MEKKTTWSRKKFDWEKKGRWKLLGTMLDKDVAKKLGCSRALIARERYRRGIPSFRTQNKFDWETGDRWKLLGTMSDGKVANKLGCARDEARRERVRRGILPSRGRGASFFDWEKKGRWKLLGTMPDPAVAEEVGCSESIVTRERRRRNIPAFQYKGNGYSVSSIIVEYTERCLGRVPKRAGMVHAAVEREYGNIQERQVYRALKLLLDQGRIQKKQYFDETLLSYGAATGQHINGYVLATKKKEVSQWNN